MSFRRPDFFANWGVLQLLQALLFLQILRGGMLVASGDDPLYIVAGSFVARGLAPFLDFIYCAGPVMPYLYAPFAWLLGPSVIASRVFGISCTILLYRVCLWSAQRLFERENPAGKSDLTVSIALTAFFLIYPEMTAALSRLGSKEAFSSICCVMAVVSLSLVDRRRHMHLIVSALFCAVSIGIKYTAGIFVAILALFLLLESVKEAFIFGLLTVCFTLPIFLPFVLQPGGIDFMWQDLQITKHAVLSIKPSQDRGFFDHLYRMVGSAIHMVVRALYKHQWPFLPVLGYLAWDVRQGGLRRMFERGSFRLFVVFLISGLLSCLVITSDMIRMNMFFPLLLISAALAMTRLWQALENGSVSVPNFARKHAGLSLSLVGALFFLNNGFLFPLDPDDWGLCDFVSWRWVLKGGPGAPARLALESLVEPQEEVLYVGPYENDFVSRRYRLSPLSAIGYQPFLGVKKYTLEEARRYHFLTEELLYDMLEEGHFRLIAWHAVLINGWPPSMGIDSRCQEVLRRRYELVSSAGVTAVFKRRL